jgi:integrase
MLRSWLVDKPADERVFAKLPKATARMIRSDLAAARSAWIDNAGQDEQERSRREAIDFLRYRASSGLFAGFHASRHTYISNIVAGNPSVKVAQELARHSTSRLTLDTYSHTRLHDVTAALDSLPPTVSQETQAEVLAATGTDDRQLSAAHAQRMRSAWRTAQGAKR